MSAAIAIITAGGVVVAADSRTCLVNSADPAAADELARGDGKRDLSHVLFHVDGVPKVWAGPTAAASWCSGQWKPGVREEFFAVLNDNAAGDVRDLARAAHAFQQRTEMRLEVVFAGYRKEGAAELWSAGVYETEGARNVTRIFGRQMMYAIGRNEAFVRLFGDLYAPLEELKPGVNPKLRKMVSTIDPAKVTLQAAVDFVIFYMELVNRMEALRNRGYQATGGPVDIAVLRKADYGISIHRVGVPGLNASVNVLSGEPPPASG